ncbi:hypothetical protein [Paeniglutamicibacter cryotolerans]|uniref:Uncharacterized protein n=1 Tax=Paeniglutamicibacter cryotolerans TaxID=670079 RepID=A0A839QUA4_9MICC|nr:hypothetical protein [Paeniglutamicibacter cryotolerans]MBB2996852.1 hypothetical protein [Paeniglutamicibacter cryotolerans]
MLLRQAHPQYGRTQATLEVLGVAAQTMDAFIEEFRSGLREHSIFRGHVISFTASDDSDSAAGITFHRRRPVSAHDVVLPDGTLDRIEAQVLEVGRYSAQLLEHGAHLKRGE